MKDLLNSQATSVFWYVMSSGYHIKQANEETLIHRYDEEVGIQVGGLASLPYTPPLTVCNLPLPRKKAAALRMMVMRI